ncbi:hypothetical protein RRG08_040747 [Elysia crispata]|uniref:Uncharacterized protein n=1 Tax=Elysia crispata TaxID=231223 RepID=A0AAE1EF07_9GAST|nr:hypothetical protein RRG08_040747 [Elysia crispata]
MKSTHHFYIHSPKRSSRIVLVTRSTKPGIIDTKSRPGETVDAQPWVHWMPSRTTQSASVPGNGCESSQELLNLWGDNSQLFQFDSSGCYGCKEVVVNTAGNQATQEQGWRER